MCNNELRRLASLHADMNPEDDLLGGEEDLLFEENLETEMRENETLLNNHLALMKKTV
uniref:Uncharacterized protein n=1 Tax=Nelumbo nucifera TaxID=4432 RepID=A0A822YW81_NELNU|nr:TPA_asm: hypothetical protein HUJ06_007438 [Nelumbo nucifera]